MLPAPSSPTRLSSDAQPHRGAGRVTVTSLSPPCWRPPTPQESSTSWSHFAREAREAAGRADSQVVRGQGRTTLLWQSCGARARPQPDRLVEPHGCGFRRCLPDVSGAEGGSRAPGTSRPGRAHRAPGLQALPRGPSEPTPSPGALPATPPWRTAVAWGGGGGVTRANVGSRPGRDWAPAVPGPATHLLLQLRQPRGPLLLRVRAA